MTALDLTSLMDASELLTAMGHAMMVIDSNGAITSWNDAAVALYGYTAEDALGADSTSLLVPAGIEQNLEQIVACLLDGRSWTGGFTCQRKDGSSVRVACTNTPVLHPDGQLKALVTVAVSLDALLRPLLALSTDAVVVVGADGLVHFTSAAMTRVFGWPETSLVGRSGLSLIHPQDRDTVGQMVASGSTGTDPEEQPVELRVRTSDGQWRWAEIEVSDLLADPAVRGTVLHLRDVTARRAAQERLAELARREPITGLANRQQMVEHLRYGRPERGAGGALLLVKVAGLKDLNHRFGHLAGDEVLRSLGVLLSALLGPQDTCSSLGGGEFLVLAEQVRTPAEAGLLSDRLQAVLHRPLRVGAGSVLPSTTIGVSLLAGRRRAHELIREAVTAAEHARRAGPGRHAVFAGTGADHGAPDSLLHQLAHALATDALRVHYQPIVELAGRATVGVEALVRWQHPTRGLLTAQAFLEPAEDSDLIHDIGAFVLKEACHQVARWPGGHLSVAVNISARQLSDPGLVDVIQDALGRAALAPQRLVLEITETALLQDLGMAVDTLAACRRLGVRVSIDDFGTGFAGFGYLRDLPLDEIKIDRSFVSGLGGGGFDAAVVGGIIDLAHRLGLRTVGEGIETAEQARLLTALGCDLGQGYLWSPAVPGARLWTTEASPSAGSPGRRVLLPVGAVEHRR